MALYLVLAPFANYTAGNVIEATAAEAAAWNAEYGRAGAVIELVEDSETSDAVPAAATPSAAPPKAKAPAKKAPVKK